MARRLRDDLGQDKVRYRLLRTTNPPDMKKNTKYSANNQKSCKLWDGKSPYIYIFHVNCGFKVRDASRHTYVKNERERSDPVYLNVSYVLLAIMCVVDLTSIFLTTSTNTRRHLLDNICTDPLGTVGTWADLPHVWRANANA